MSSKLSVLVFSSKWSLFVFSYRDCWACNIICFSLLLAPLESPSFENMADFTCFFLIIPSYMSSMLWSSSISSGSSLQSSFMRSGICKLISIFVLGFSKARSCNLFLWLSRLIDDFRRFCPSHGLGKKYEVGPGEKSSVLFNFCTDNLCHDVVFLFIVEFLF